MKKVAIGLALAGPILVGIPMAYSTAKGYTTWWFTVPGAKVLADGTAVDAWVHRGQTWQEMIVTFQEGGNRVSYHWNLGEDRVNGRCPTAVPFPVFREGDLMDPDCLVILPEGAAMPESPERDVVFGQRELQFLADDGKRIEVRWQNDYSAIHRKTVAPGNATCPVAGGVHSDQSARLGRATTPSMTGEGRRAVESTRRTE